MTLRPRYPIQFLVALIAAFLLWYIPAAQRSENISVRGVKARLTVVNVPSNLVVTSSVPDTVSLQLRGPLTLTRTLGSRYPPEVLLDLSTARPGLNLYRINASDITADNVRLPAEVDVASIDPQEITLEVERQAARLIPIRPLIDGEPAPGFVLGEVLVVPWEYTVEGPESLILALESVGTSPVSIEGATGPVEAVVQPALPNPQLRALGVGLIQVIVDIVPETVPEEEDVTD